MVRRLEGKAAVGKNDATDNGRYVFVKKSDPGREILITTLLLDVTS
jgi:hypothetical protein